MLGAKVRAKFFVASKTVYGTGGSGSVLLQPVVSGSEENKAFWEYTPNGKIELHIQKGDALDKFVGGAEYYIDFTPAAVEEK